MAAGDGVAVGSPSLVWPGAHPVQAAQPATGISTGSTYILCAGYWCGMDAEHPIYLPLVLRDA